MKLKDSVIIVTGAGSGVGRALALEYAKRGANVVCCGRRVGRLEETLKLIKAENGAGLAVAVDITVPEQVRRAVHNVLDSFGRIDVLFNNAGSFRSIAGILESDPEIWWEDVRINLFGTYLMTREALPLMMKTDSGIIINMDGGRPPGGSAYGASKAGVAELTRILLKELEMLESSIMVFLAGPGLVRTEMTELQAESEAGRKWIPSTYEIIEKNHTRKPEEIAVVTSRLIELARPEWNGMSFGPDTDFDKLLES
jgi:NAD(P)-dependent dehydrogenase (short-subunit alcohol dehydrogenase family)